MRSLFSQFGSITNLKFFKNCSTKANTKNCILDFPSSSSVEAAFKNRANMHIKDHPLKISPLKLRRNADDPQENEADLEAEKPKSDQPSTDDFEVQEQPKKCQNSNSTGS